jgi:curved DNA-binding protein CbpA
MRREWLDVDYYAVLGVAPTASHDEIVQAYRRLAHEWHPDARPDDPHATERFARINAAYEVLGEPMVRAEYDQIRLIAEPPRPASRPRPAGAWSGPPGYDPDDDDLWEQWPPRESPIDPIVVAPPTGRRRIRPRWMPAPVAFVVVGGLLLATGLVVAWQQQRVPGGWVETAGVIVESSDFTRPGRYSEQHYRTIEYRDQQDGVVRRSFESQAELGSVLKVAYDPKSRSYKILDANWQVVAVFLACGAAVLVAGAGVSLFTAPARRFPLGHTFRPR